MLKSIGNRVPKAGKELFLAPDAWVIGDVEVGDNVSIFFGAVLRGDILPIRVGSGTNIQEHSILHTSQGRTPTLVGEMVTIGHRAIIHGASVGDRSIIGMGSIILDEAVIGEESIVGAGSVVTTKKVFPPRSMIIGSPAKVVRSLTDEEVLFLKQSAANYIEAGKFYQSISWD